MTPTDKPTQVGGLPELPELPTQVADVYFTDDDFDVDFMPGMPCGNGPLFTADQLRAYAQANVQALEARLVALEKKWRDESVSGFDGNGNLSDTWTAQAMRFCADELTALLESKP